MTDTKLTDVVAQTAERFQIPGVAAAVLVDGQEIHASSGVTSIENPLSVNQDTLFMIGSVSKTFTATALMRLVDQGKAARAMTALVRTAKANDRKLRLSADLPPHARRLMEIVGLLPFVPIADDPDIESFNPPG